MKKFLALVLAIAVMLPLLSMAAVLDPSVTTNVPVKNEYPVNPSIPGVSPTTGLPFTGVYAPVLCVFSNAPDAYPHWGIGQADIVYQVPNGGGGATKLMAFFSDNMPQKAGGFRSARTPFADFAFSWGASFVFAGTPGEDKADPINVYKKIRNYGYRRDTTYFDVLGNGTYHHRETSKMAPQNLVANIAQIQAMSIMSGQTFTPQPFKFADSEPASSIIANQVDITLYSNPEKGQVNEPNSSTFNYDAVNNAYTRTSASGINVDESNLEQPLLFSNVIVMRMKYGGLDSYVYLSEPLGSGRADFFIGGKYIPGAWVRKTTESRYIYVDEAGEEIALNPGKTFIVVVNDKAKVEYQ